MTVEKKINGTHVLASQWPPVPGRESVVFIHGASFDKTSWEPQVEGLARHFNCFAPDLPGHGGTPGPGRQSIEDYARFVETFVPHLGITRPVICGLSMGGAVVQSMLVRKRLPCSAGILMNTSSKLVVSPTLFNAVRKRYRAYVNMLVSFGTSEKSDRAHLTPLIERFSRCDSEVACGDFTACNDFDLTLELGRIEAPVLVIGGSDDRITPPALSVSLHQHIAGSSLEIFEDTGHFPCVERPAKTNQAILSFIQALAPAEFIR